MKHKLIESDYNNSILISCLHHTAYILNQKVSMCGHGGVGKETLIND